MPPLRKIVGPGVISAGVGLATGEFIIWPCIGSLVGLAFLWVAFLAVTTRFFIDVEVERYALATGEAAVAGFSRLWKPWGLVFCVATILPNLFPAWVTSGAARIENGRHTPPERPGYSTDMRPGSLEGFEFPTGKAWADAEGMIP